MCLSQLVRLFTNYLKCIVFLIAFHFLSIRSIRTQKSNNKKYIHLYTGSLIHNYKSVLFGDNRSVVTSATLPHSTLTKRHNILAFHRAREAIAAILMAFYWIQSAYNLSHVLSKHWDHRTVYPMILKLFITRGNITLLPKEATQEKEKENFKLQPEKLEKKEKEE